MIVIKDIEMPKSCAVCKFGCITINDYRKCKLNESCYIIELTEEKRPTDCPLAGQEELEKLKLILD